MGVWETILSTDGSLSLRPARNRFRLQSGYLYVTFIHLHCAHISLYTCMYIYMYVYIYIYVFIFLKYVCTHVCVCVCTYTVLHTRTHLCRLWLADLQHAVLKIWGMSGVLLGSGSGGCRLCTESSSESAAGFFLRIDFQLDLQPTLSERIQKPCRPQGIPARRPS